MQIKKLTYLSSNFLAKASTWSRSLSSSLKGSSGLQLDVTRGGLFFSCSKQFINNYGLEQFKCIICLGTTMLHHFQRPRSESTKVLHKWKINTIATIPAVPGVFLSVLELHLSPQGHAACCTALRVRWPGCCWASTAWRTRGPSLLQRPTF